jgi:hypothetical protein
MFGITRRNPLGLTIHTFKKQVLFRDRYQWEGGGHKERVNEGKYSG